MIDLKRRIVNQEPTRSTENINVNSSIVDEASVKVNDNTVQVKIFILKNETEIQNFDAPANFVDVFGTDRVYKFLFVLLREVTDMDKNSISSYLRSDPVAGWSMSNRYFEVLIKVPKDRILSEPEFYRS